MVKVVFDDLVTSNKLPSPPVIVSKIFLLADDPNSSLRDFSRVISCDVGLVVQLIKVANSAFYCAKNPIVDIDQAVNVIGLSALIPLVVSFSFKGLMETSDSPLDFDSFWERSVLLSSVSAFLSVYACGVSREEALLAGLLQDFGILAVSAVYPDNYLGNPALFSSDHIELVATEEAVFSINHSTIGSMLLGSWGFPLSISNAVLCSHRLPNNDVRDVGWCVSGANVFVSQIIQGIESGDLCRDIHTALSQPWLGLPEGDRVASLTSLLCMVSEISSLFDVKLLPDDILKDGPLDMGMA